LHQFFVPIILISLFKIFYLFHFSIYYPCSYVIEAAFKFYNPYFSIFSPEIEKMVSEVSPDSLKSYINTLVVAFGARSTLSTQSDKTKGIGAARNWVPRGGWCPTNRNM